MFKTSVAAACCLGMLVCGVRAEDLVAKAPEKCRMRFETIAGDFGVEVHRKWAPIGADRFHKLIKKGVLK